MSERLEAAPASATVTPATANRIKFNYLQIKDDLDRKIGYPFVVMPPTDDPEKGRLEEKLPGGRSWKRWGPYLSERQWGTVREDYSANGDCWRYLPHDHSRSRAYRWGEDGLLGISDSRQRLCFALALWNGHDPILKERLFGLTPADGEGNHGEDCKELYYYLDATPTHSYLKALYKYPQTGYPYDELVAENKRRGALAPEFEITDTNAFLGNRYFDVFAEYAKAAPEDVLIRVTVANRGPEPAPLSVLPTIWFRNTWSWGRSDEHLSPHRPRLSAVDGAGANMRVIACDHETLGRYALYIETTPELLFTENETNFTRLFASSSGSPYVKDAFHEHVIRKARTVNPKQVGTKAAAHFALAVPAGGELVLRLRLTGAEPSEERPALPLTTAPFGKDFDEIFSQRMAEADTFYRRLLSPDLTDDERLVSRQAYAGLLWSKQFYAYDVRSWLEGDPTQPAPPASRKKGRNSDWPYLSANDLLSMPDKWEYPWFAAWDLAFHMIPFCKVDPDFSKSQLRMLLREWYMHPSGQIPAYEFSFSDVNPPVHAWAAWRVYKMTAPAGSRDHRFLETVFHKLLLNFTWWVNRKDDEGNNLFAGGFLGLDNIGVFDRSKPLPLGGHLEQADGTAWMAFYCTTMLAIALELASKDDAYDEIATKFFEHFAHISDAMNSLGGTGLWDENDGFYYDQLHGIGDGVGIPLKVRSLVGLVPLFAVDTLDAETIDRLPRFRKRMKWFLEHRNDLNRQVAFCPRTAKRFLLAIPSKERLKRVLTYLLDPNEFLSPHGIRSLSKFHEKNPYVLWQGGQSFRVDYTPGESSTNLFGGNSNWRGPVWFPMNYLLIEALERYHHFYGDDFKVEYPTGSGTMKNLREISADLWRRLGSLFLGKERPAHGGVRLYADDPHFQKLVLFYEYFHGDTGAGLGASHQTGWTALAVRCLDDMARMRRGKNP